VREDIGGAPWPLNFAFVERSSWSTSFLTDRKISIGNRDRLRHPCLFTHASSHVLARCLPPTVPRRNKHPPTKHLGYPSRDSNGNRFQALGGILLQKPAAAFRMVREDKSLSPDRFELEGR
jgi:hypothetical protein